MVNQHPPFTPPAQYEGDALKLTVDVRTEAVAQGTSVSSAAWTVEDGDASVSGEALASNVATALITTTNDGISKINVVITLADNQIINQIIKVVCKDSYVTDTRYPS